MQIGSLCVVGPQKSAPRICRSDAQPDCWHAQMMQSSLSVLDLVLQCSLMAQCEAESQHADVAGGTSEVA